MPKTVRRPASKGFPTEIHTLGDHIRKIRMERGLFQSDVAKIIGVSTDTVTYWETNRCEPQISNYPAITTFLGYFPGTVEADTFGGKITKYRIEHGLSLKAFARLSGADPDSIKLWEEGKGRPSRRMREHVMSIVEGSTV